MLTWHAVSAINVMNYSDGHVVYIYFFCTIGIFIRFMSILKYFSLAGV